MKVADVTNYRPCCAFCDVEHEAGKCFEQDERHYVRAVRLHKTQPNVRIHRETRVRTLKE